jgi:hypothetical protein
MSQVPTRQSRASGAGSRWRTVVVVGFGVTVLVFAGMGFVYKMAEFTMTIVNDDIEGFGAAAVAVYLLGLLPMVFINLWAILTGRFRDIERPKYRMLELDREIERGGELRRPHA